jgi:tripartite-type tricarboxylate transporter receptor subunit TctC
LWIGMMAPAGTPRPIIDKLALAAQHATQARDLAERLKRDGVRFLRAARRKRSAR